jgi:hypothetical protein
LPGSFAGQTIDQEGAVFAKFTLFLQIEASVLVGIITAENFFPGLKQLTSLILRGNAIELSFQKWAEIA